MHTKNYFLFIILAVFIIGGAACSHKSTEKNPIATTQKLYQCPMHPQYTSDKPGHCPICQMEIVPVENNSTSDTKTGGTDSSGKGRILYYRNPMNPAVTSPVFMKDDMGMDYVPVYESEVSSQTAVSGQGLVKVQKEDAQKIGVNVSPVEKRNLSMTIKAPSRVAYDPNLYSAILEYQEALKNHDASSVAGQTEARATVRASQLRLRQMGLSDQQIADINQPGFDPSNLLLGRAGGNIWVYVDVYDYEAGFVKTGQQAEFTTPAFPGQVFTGTVKAVDAILNSETRTLRVRVEVPNPHGDLKPEMYLSGNIKASIGKKLAIPDSAVLDTGVRQLVYVQTGDGQFEPREVRVGREASGYYEVLSGVAEGEKVVTSANFFIDSESKIRAAAQGAK